MHRVSKMSAAFPDIKPQHASVSPLLAEAVNDNLAYFTKMNKMVLELIQEVAAVHDKAASSIMSVVDTFRKKINDSSKAKPQCQSESYEKFIQRLFEQLELQAKTLQTVSGSFNECVVVPVREVIDKKKDVWKTCFYYVASFQQQIKQKEDDLVKRYKDCCDASNKIKSSVDGKGSNKQQLMYHNSHNTYLLRLSSVNSINKLLYTHVLPYVLHSIEKNQAEINDSLRHHIKYMFTVQKETLKKVIKSVDKIDHATEKVDLVGDLHKFIKSIKGQVKDKTPPQHEFASPNFVQGRRASVIDPLQETFIVNQYTQPNLQRRLAALQHQTSELVDNIATLRAGEKKEEFDPNKVSEDQALQELIELLSICDKEANLNVLLKQMELYTPEITDFLGPISGDFLQERKHSKRSPTRQLQRSDGSSQSQIPHKFAELRSVKPLHCFYCHKLVTTFGKGYVCKSCKMPVHKKCATNVPFCEGVDVRAMSSSTSSDVTSNTLPVVKSKAECAEVHDLIDLESDDDYGYFDDDEFDDGLSDEDLYDELEPESSTSPQVLFTQPIPLESAGPSKPLPRVPLPQKHAFPFNKPKEIIPPPLPYRPPTGSSSQPMNPNPKPALKPVLSAKPVLAKKPVLAAKPSLPTTPSLMRKKCVALYDYKSSEPSELPFTSGTIIEISGKNDIDWWKGLCNGFEGYFPRSYVKEISNGDRILRTMYSFTAQNSKELTVTEGEILVLLQHENEWLRVMSSNAEGLVPASYVEYL